jgi:hypothetical protein
MQLEWLNKGGWNGLPGHLAPVAQWVNEYNKMLEGNSKRTDHCANVDMACCWTLLNPSNCNHKQVKYKWLFRCVLSIKILSSFVFYFTDLYPGIESSTSQMEFCSRRWAWRYSNLKEIPWWAFTRTPSPSFPVYENCKCFLLNAFFIRLKCVPSHIRDKKAIKFVILPLCSIHCC